MIITQAPPYETKKQQKQNIDNTNLEVSPKLNEEDLKILLVQVVIYLTCLSKVT